MAAKIQNLPQKNHERAGIWSTASEAIAAGWGATIRMIVILLVRGGILIGAALAASGPAQTAFQALLGWH